MGFTVQEKPKGSGVWHVVRHFDGRKQSWKIGPKAKAEQVARELRARMLFREHGLERKPEAEKGVSFRDCALLWMETFVKPTKKQSTARGYESILKLHLLPEFGRIPLSDIQRSDIRAFLARKIEGGLTPTRAKRIKAALSGVFAFAMEDDLIGRNPAAGLDRYLGNKDEGLTGTKPDPFSAGELATYLRIARDHEPRYFPFFLTLARTGLRLGEALGMRWEDVRFAEGFVEIRRALVDGKTTTPKSGKARRVPISPELSATLETLKADREAEGGSDGAGWVFVNREGRPLDGRNMRARVHRRICERAGLRTIRLHDFRHTYATLRIAAGHNIAEVSKHLGHASIKITIDLYHHWSPDQGRDEVAELDRMGLEEGAQTRTKRA